MINREQHYEVSELLRMQQQFRLLIATETYHLQLAIIHNHKHSVRLAYQDRIIEAEKWLAICNYKLSRE